LGYVMLIAFSLQQCLHVRVWKLRYAYFASPVSKL
jgi:hypothetical protein